MRRLSNRATGKDELSRREQNRNETRRPFRSISALRFPTCSTVLHFTYIGTYFVTGNIHTIHRRPDSSAGPIRLLPVSPFGSESADRHTPKTRDRARIEEPFVRRTYTYGFLRPVRDGKNEIIIPSRKNFNAAADEIVPANSVVTSDVQCSADGSIYRWYIYNGRNDVSDVYLVLAAPPVFYFFLTFFPLRSR